MATQPEHITSAAALDAACRRAERAVTDPPGITALIWAQLAQAYAAIAAAAAVREQRNLPR